MTQLFGGGKSVAATPTKPEEPKPERMPTDLDPLIMAAKMRTFDKAQARTGRASTILTDALKYTTNT